LNTIRQRTEKYLQHFKKQEQETAQKSVSIIKDPEFVEIEPASFKYQTEAKNQKLMINRPESSATTKRTIYVTTPNGT
jgi:hypothetical protein